MHHQVRLTAASAPHRGRCWRLRQSPFGWMCSHRLDNMGTRTQESSTSGAQMCCLTITELHNCLFTYKHTLSPLPVGLDREELWNNRWTGGCPGLAQWFTWRLGKCQDAAVPEILFGSGLFPGVSPLYSSGTGHPPMITEGRGIRSSRCFLRHNMTGWYGLRIISGYF